jgi:hypothetical protein
MCDQSLGEIGSIRSEFTIVSKSCEANGTNTFSVVFANAVIREMAEAAIFKFVSSMIF